MAKIAPPADGRVAPPQTSEPNLTLTHTVQNKPSPPTNQHVEVFLASNNLVSAAW